MSRRVCGACGAKNDLSAVVCSKCGAAMKKKRRPPLRPTRKAGQGGAFYTLLDLFPGLTRTRVAAWAAAALVVAGVMAYLTVKLLAADSEPPSLLTGLFGLVCYLTALTWLLYGYVVVPWDAFVTFDGRKWLVLLGLGVVPIAIVAALVPGG